MPPVLLSDGGPDERAKRDPVGLSDLLPSSPADGVLPPGAPAPPSGDEASLEEDEVEDMVGLSSAIEAATGRSDLAARILRKEQKEEASDGEEGTTTETRCRARKRFAAGSGEELTLEMMLGGRDKEILGIDIGIGKEGKEEGMVVAVPKPKVVLERVERDVAYGITKHEMSRWTPEIRAMKKQRTLKFPLNVPTAHLSRSSHAMAASYKKQNEFEKEIDELLKEGNIIGGDREVEQLVGENGEASREKERQRIKQLAKMRREMSYYEGKLKRMKKVKSKRYRKELKKDKVNVSAEKDSEKAEKARVEERMRLRHRNTSKWVKRQLERHDGDKVAVAEQLRIGQELRKKQQSMKQDDSDESSAESGDDTRDLSAKQVDPKVCESQRRKGLMGMAFMKKAESRRRAAALALLAEMKEEDDLSCDDAGPERQQDNVTELNERHPGRRTFYGLPPNEESSLARAAETSDDERELTDGEDRGPIRKYLLEDKELDEKARERELKSRLNVAALSEGTEAKEGGFKAVLLGRLGVDLQKHVKSESTAEGHALRTKEHEAGEKVRDPGLSLHPDSVNEKAPTPNLKSNTSTLPGKYGNQLSVSANRNSNSTGRAAGKVTFANNPWLKPQDPENRILKKAMQRSTNNPLQKPSEESRKRSRIQENEPESASGDLRKGNEAEAHMRVPLRKKRRKDGQSPNRVSEEARVNAQRARMELVARAFAGAGGADEAEFQAAKVAEIEKTLPTAEDVGATVLPGWGSWGGEEIDRKLKSGELKETEFARKARMKLEEARKQAMMARKDGTRGMERVIISEKRVKGQRRLSLPSVPFPFANAEEWERSIAVPLGKQFVTPKVHRDALAPSIRKASGECIAPIRAGKRAVIEKRRQRAKLRENNRKGLTASMIR